MSLVRAGHDVVLLAPHDHDEETEGVRIRAVPRPRGRLRRMTRTVIHLYREAVRQHADVYHIHDPELIPVGLLLRMGGRKVVYDIHEDFPRDVLAKGYMPRWLRRAVGLIVGCVEGIACGRFSAVVPATPAIAERLGQRNGRTALVQNFPLVDELASGNGGSWTGRERAVAYIGGLGPDRGVLEMVQAVERCPGIRLKLAGRFPPGEPRNGLKDLKGWGQVDELGFVDRPGVRDLLGTVRAGLVVLHPTPAFVRSQPVKLFEYMSAGIPVIASDFPLWRQIVQGSGCGLLVDPSDVNAIGRAIGYLADHPEEAEEMGRRGRRAVKEQYNWALEEQQLLRLYDRLG
ncbi:MAG: glycosyltransferase family 4 protein [Planctomycetota bacterium]